MNRSFQLRATALGLGHFLIVLVLLHAGVEWGNFRSAAAALFHALLFPGEDIYMVLPPDAVVAVLVAYPLNSALWGIGLARLWQSRARCRGTPPL